MEYRNYQTSAETTSPRHRMFSIEGILGLDQAPTAQATLPAAQSEIPAKSRIGRRRRSRTVCTPEQMDVLESVFAVDQYPDINSRDALANALDMKEARVQVWFANRRARLRRETKRKSSSSPSETSSTSADSVPRQIETPASPEISSITSHCLSPTRIPQRCTQACCSPPPIICTSASCSSCPSSTKSSYSTNLPSYGLHQQYYNGAFAYTYYPHQHAYYYRPSAYTTVSSAYQGSPIYSVPKFPPVARVEPVTNVLNVRRSSVVIE